MLANLRLFGVRVLALLALLTVVPSLASAAEGDVTNLYTAASVSAGFQSFKNNVGGDIGTGVALAFMMAAVYFSTRFLIRAPKMGR